MSVESKSAEIRVSVRCRPFVQNDTLGVQMRTIDDETAEIELINSKVTYFLSLIFLVQ